MSRIDLIASDQSLDESQYISTLQMASKERQPAGSMLANAGLLRNVSTLNILSDRALFSAIMQCNFDGLNVGKLSLALFNPLMKDPGARPTFSRRMIIAQGLGFLKTLRGVFDDTKEGLEGVDTKYMMVADDFLVNKGERTLKMHGIGRYGHLSDLSSFRILI
jgi:hypothetical protein